MFAIVFIVERHFLRCRRVSSPANLHCVARCVSSKYKYEKNLITPPS